MTLYDEYRKEHPINPEPSEFRDIVEAEVKRALEWMRGRDKPLPAKAIKPGRYMLHPSPREVEVIVCPVEACGRRETCDCHLLMVSEGFRTKCIIDFIGATFQAVKEE